MTRKETESANDDEKKNFFKKDNEAHVIIGMSIRDSIILIINKVKSSNEAWEILRKIYESVNESILLYLRNKLYRLKMIDSDIVIEHLTNLDDIANQLGALGNEIDEATLASVALNSLSKNFAVLVTSIEVS